MINEDDLKVKETKKAEEKIPPKSPIPKIIEDALKKDGADSDDSVVIFCRMAEMQ